MQGDLLFSGAERVIRTVTRECEDFDVAILDVARLDNINDPARRMLAGIGSQLRSAGKQGFLVDPDGAVIKTQRQFDAFAFTTVDDAVSAAQTWLSGDRRS